MSGRSRIVCGTAASSLAGQVARTAGRGQQHLAFAKPIFLAPAAPGSRRSFRRGHLTPELPGGRRLLSSAPGGGSGGSNGGGSSAGAAESSRNGGSPEQATDTAKAGAASAEGGSSGGSASSSASAAEPKQIYAVTKAEDSSVLTIPFRHSMRLLNLYALNLGYPGCWEGYEAFREGTVQAVSMVYGAANEGDLASLRGVLSRSCLEALEEDVANAPSGAKIVLRDVKPLGIWTARPRVDEGYEGAINAVQVVMVFQVVEEYTPPGEEVANVVTRASWITFERRLGENGEEHGDWELIELSPRRWSAESSSSEE
eukprot:TRINITY_DN13999_c0_g1_i2.p1 TRINITY_DN13999_c0_g1~~TRINITY_DN13999_c0_g1_i2.p1  ORF type:complete len:334 (+),score=69.17 TRINITY_DN13999_c0_g1_i2:61-1002(+)